MSAPVSARRSQTKSLALFRGLSLLAMFACLFCLTGCVSERDSGTAKIYTIDLWVSALLLIIGLAAAPAGYFLREWSDRVAWGLMIVGPILALGVAPSLFLNKTTVAAEELNVRCGIWGTTGYHVKYDNLNSVRLTTEVTRGRRGRKNTNHYLVCDCKDGTSTKLPLSNDCVEQAAPHFLQLVQAKGVPFGEEGAAE
jgi:hypothetical protein